MEKGFSLTSGFGVPKKNKKRKSGTAIARAAFVEQLEPRRLLSGSIVINGSGQVTVTGTTSSDVITAVVDPNNASNILFTVATNGVGTVSQSIAASSITSVVVNTDPIGAQITGTDNDFVNFAGITLPANGTVGIQGGPGNDTIYGQQGPNEIFGGDGNDYLIGGRSDDTISGQNGNDTLRGAAGNDILFGDAGDDVIFGGAGNDQLFGNGGNDTLRAMPGADSCYGGDGNDVIIGGGGADFIRGDTGNDTLFGGFSNNSTINGNAGNDYVAGHWEGFLVAQGISPLTNTGGNQIYGGGGNDTLASYGGADTLGGQGGADYYSAGPAADVTDFISGDTLASANTNTSPLTDFTITLTVNLDIAGNVFTVNIPNGAGSVNGGTSNSEAVDANGTIRFRSDNASQPFTLGDFFTQWGVDFNSSGVGQYTVVGGGHSLSMTVNGVSNAQFDQLQVTSGMNIVVTYTF